MGKKVKELKKHKEDFALRPVFNWWKNIFMLLTISWDVVKKSISILVEQSFECKFNFTCFLRSLKVLMNKQSTYLGSQAHTKKK